MAASDRITGKNLKVLWVDGSGTLDISGDRRTFTPNLQQNTVEGAAGNDAATYAAATLKSYSASVMFLSEGTVGTAMLARIAEGLSGSLFWGEQGTTTGLPKWAFPALVSKVSPSIPYDGMIEISIDFAGQGDLAFDGRSDTW